MLIDTHCHLHDVSTYDFAYNRQRQELPRTEYTPEKMLERAAKAGVSKIICIGTSHEDSLAAGDFANQHENVFFSYGIHPDEAATVLLGSSELLDALSKVACDQRGAIGEVSPVTTGGNEPETEEEASKGSPKLVAIGEVGLDYRNGTGAREAQIRLLEEMMQLAKDRNLPLIFHVREAFSDFFAVLDNFPGAIGVVHSFSDSEENMHEALERGFYIGVNGLATFANLPLAPLERILLETDAPFLTPAPFRGTINESAHIKDIALWLSKKLGVPETEIARRTTENAEQLFGI